MGLFKKKANAPIEADAATNVPSKKGGRNKKNELVKVLDESVWESVHEELKNNTQFVITEDGDTRYVAFLFDTTSLPTDNRASLPTSLLYPSPRHISAPYSAP